MFHYRSAFFVPRVAVFFSALTAAKASIFIALFTIALFGTIQRVLIHLHICNNITVAALHALRSPESNNIFKTRSCQQRQNRMRLLLIKYHKNKYNLPARNSNIQRLLVRKIPVLY